MWEFRQRIEEKCDFREMIGGGGSTKFAKGLRSRRQKLVADSKNLVARNDW